MGSIATLALVFVAWLAVRWVMNDQPKGRGRRFAFDPQTGQVTVSDRRHPVLAALLAAAVGYGVARWRDRRDLADRAEAMPENVMACRRCGQSITDDPIAGWIGPRGSGRCVGRAPHSPERALTAGR